MPLRDDILAPIPGENPSGENLEYAPVYDQIREARREEDDAPQGDWQRARKVADWKLVMQLASDALASQSKDLQLAAWLTEALFKRESFGGLRAGLEMCKALVENFWETLYPPVEDGDLDYRVAPLDWIGSYLVEATKWAPLTKAGYGLLKYRESRAVGYEDDESKAKNRQSAIDDGKLTAEAFDKAVQETSKDFYQALVENLDGCLASLQALAAACEEKFGSGGPSFSKLREALEEVQRLANQFYQKKREESGELDQPESGREEEEPSGAAEAVAVGFSGAAAAPARAPVKKVAAGLVPADKEEVPLRLVAVAKFLREQDGYDPAPYLLLRGYRWGELRRAGASPDPTLFEAPSTEVRTQLKKAILDCDWTTAIELAETAMAQPCGRAWLDLQRYSVTALETYGYPEIAAAIKSEVRALLRDIPNLRTAMLMDDTPAANAETQAWLEAIAEEAGASSAPAAPIAMSDEEEAEALPAGEPAAPDTYELALEAIRRGRSREALELLAAEIARQTSGRGRFRRKQQLAELCLKAGQAAIAQPILEELAAEIDEHRLEDWEASDTVAYPLTMLLECLHMLDGASELRQKIYNRICRLDPVQALSCKP